ncbi:MAG: hypothetical protein U1F30_14595 [Steroidobacteraceae bacterium]
MHTRVRDAIAAVAGVLALACYILACGPAFSPDDSRLLFASNDPAGEHLVMALYDRRTRTSRPLLVLPIGSTDSFNAYAWTPDGREALALWMDADDALQVAAVPLHDAATVRRLRIDAVIGDDVLEYAWHPVVVGGQLYLGGNGHVWCIDLLHGGVRSLEVAGQPRLVAANGRIFYARALPPAADGRKRVEVGRLDAGPLALVPQFFADGAGHEVFAVSMDGTRVALDVADSDTARLLVFERGVPQRTLDVRAAAPELEFAAMPQWSADATRLYATYRRPLDGQRNEYGVLELPANGGAPRLQVLLATGRANGVMPVDISHDGRTLATTSTFLQKPLAESQGIGAVGLDARDLALFLVDLGDARHRVTRIPIPPAGRPRGP